MDHLHPAEGPPPQPSHNAYETKWRPTYLPPYEQPKSRCLSATTQDPSSPQEYPLRNRSLLQLPPDGSYGRPSSLPGPPHPITEAKALQATYSQMNGPFPEASPQSVTPGSHLYMGVPPSDPPVSTESTPPISSHLPPTTQYMRAPPPPSTDTPTSCDAFYNPNGARQRKANRATQACNECRVRKAKCDEGRPSCSHCKENEITCVYKEIPREKQEKGTQQIIDKITESGDKNMNELERIRNLFQGQDTQLARISHSQSTVIQNQAAQIQSHNAQMARMHQLISQFGGDAARSMSNSLEPTLKHETPSLMTKPEITSAPASFAPPPPPSTGPDSLLAALTEDMKHADNEGELTIPVEHTTAAHKLLMWPVIKTLISPKEYDEDYVMRLEEERGLISVYGQGENSFTADGTSFTPQPNGLGDNFASADDILHPNNESMSGDLRAEITRSGLLNLEPETARRYFTSYLDRMHALHPFLDRMHQEKKLEELLRYYCLQSYTGQEVNSLCRGDGRSPKQQKRSHEPRGGSNSEASSTRLRVGMNIDNAVILLILAVGAICDAQNPLPGPIMDEPMNYLNQYIPTPWPSLPAHLQQANDANGTSFGDVLSPVNAESAPIPSATSSFYGNSIMVNSTQSFPSAQASTAHETLSRRHVSNCRDEYGHVKNLEVIPGLAFYGYATAILGHLQGGVELEHVQAGLFAGLYASQLAHPFQSHGWICQAARACQVLVRQRRYERFEEGITKDLYNFAYWTCLQLESDLLAELDIPASGISRLEDRIGLPSGKYTLMLDDGTRAKDTNMMLHYSAQVHLRKILNWIHTDLYNVKENATIGARRSLLIQETLDVNLELWRNSLPAFMQWKDSDTPATEINAARMRAKYYEARYIIHRPLLFHGLHHPDQYKNHNNIPLDGAPGFASASRAQQMSPSMTSGSVRATRMARMKSDLGTTPTNLSPDEFAKWEVEEKEKKWRKLCRACRVCVESAILSTEAFDGLEDRLVVTNIFGTAHAQFGNMLVLSATYMSELNELVERPVLERLLRRTVMFLLFSKNISPTLRADARILTEIYEKIFGHGSFRASR